MSEVNERILKIVGSVVLPEPLKMKHDYAIGVIINITERAEKDRDDGTVDIIYKGRLCGAVAIEKDFGKKIFANYRASPSKKLRQRIWNLWAEKEEGDFDKYYEKVMAQIISNLDDIIEKYV